MSFLLEVMLEEVSTELSTRKNSRNNLKRQGTLRAHMGGCRYRYGENFVSGKQIRMYDYRSHF